MSESCPNCGSAGRLLASGSSPHTCGVVTWTDADGKEMVSKETDACQLIRSLREELAEARDAERDRIADWLTAQAGISGELWLENENTLIGEYFRGSMNAENQAVTALRNNEHRSDT